MSEYQFYEFQAIDRPLTAEDREVLRGISSRGKITATSFTNSYQWGNFRGDPTQLMQRCFDLHLYLANWGSRRLMIRLPAHLVDRQRLEALVADVECAELIAAGDCLILDIARDELDLEDWGEDSERLAALAPLRADIMSGDLRLFYLLWLTEVEADALDEDEPEPMPGIGPLTGSLKAFAEFFGIDADLVDAAAERHAAGMPAAIDAEAGKQIIATLSDTEKTGMLSRLFDGDPHVAYELRARVAERLAPSDAGPADVPRTVGELRLRALAVGQEHELAAAARQVAERKRREDEAEAARQVRLVSIRRRGEHVWKDVEAEIERRNAQGYGKAVELLGDLRALADQERSTDDFHLRVNHIRDRHAGKRAFIARLTELSLP